jgi:hypothetical protein
MGNMRKMKEKWTFGRLFLILILFLFLFSSLIVTNVAAPRGMGPITLSGRVYDSNGENLPDGFDEAHAEVLLEHEGERDTFIDFNGIEQDNDGVYWYSVYIPDEKWELNDTYWVRINGTGWGDLNFTCRSHENPDKFKWRITDYGAVYNDVNTVDSKFDWEGEDEFPVLLVAIIGIVVAVVVVIIYGLRHYGYF